MGTIVYKKAPIVLQYRTEEKPAGQQQKFFHKRRLYPIVFVTIGSMLVANVTWPIISYQLISSPQLQMKSVLSPLSEDSTLKYTPTVVVENPVQKVSANEEAQRLPEGPEIISEDLDYTNLSNWFPNTVIPESSDVERKAYTVDIPALNLKDMQTYVGGTDLSKGLIQYPGTANPGELGTPVIFGHSTNPLFYSPGENNRKRYTSIFTKLMDLKKDDKIFVTYDGITYVYRVIDKVEVKPDDTYILQQRHDTRELKLVTCVPVGTYLRRGVILAQLDDIQ